jgi:urease accessory protein
MLRATSVKAAGTWPGDAADSVVLDYDNRRRRRLAMTGVGGLQFLLDLPHAAALRDGDALALDDGRLVAVRAADEDLLEIAGRGAEHGLRLAWHLGNRHLLAQVLGDRIRIRHDQVIAGMLIGLGATVTRLSAPFQPEGGAYGVPGAGHGHGHPLDKAG